MRIDMSVCEPMVSLMLRSVEGDLDAADRDLVTHLAGCPACAQALAVQVAVKRALADLPLAEVSTDFAARVRARVAPPQWLDAFNWQGWTIRLAPVAVLLALLAVLPAQRGSSTDATTQTVSGAIDAWTASSAGAGAGSLDTTVDAASSSSHMQLLLNPDADPNALLAAALEGASR
jgi:anti-sigma factor RsiW